MNYPWPGNIRELKNSIEEHLIKSTSNVIQTNELSSELFYSEPQENKVKTKADFEALQNESMKLFIKSTLEKSQSKSMAARTLGVSPSRLHYILEKLNL